jgi:DNA-binding MarR family transcriptional regulator
LRRSDASVLKVLAKEGEQRSGDLAAKLHVDPSVVSRQVSTLESHGLVSRRPDPADARVCLVALSQEGRERLDALFAGYTHQLRSVLDWDDEQMAAAAEVLRRVAAAVGQASGSTRRPSTTT